MSESSRPARITVFCGSAPGVRPEYTAVARELGHLLADQGVGLVYGGGQVGLMGTLADAVLEAGGDVTGIIPTHLADKELAHPRVADMRIVAGMHERKQLMAELADGFIALPGGPGTLEEITEQWTWSQLGYHSKPCVLVSTAGYYDHLLAHIRHMVDEGFIAPAQAGIMTVVPDPEAALEAIGHYVPPLAKWA